MQVHTEYNQISHKGIFSRVLQRHGASGVTKREMERSSQYVAHLLGESAYSVDNIMKDADKARVELLKDLARKYCARNAELPIAKREGKDELLQIFEDVKKPLPEHFDILRSSKYGFDSLKTIFSLAQDEKSLEFVSKLQGDILRGKPNQSDTIIKLLSSKHRSMFIDNIEQYSSYLKLSSGDADALKKLDSIIDNRKYDNKKYDSKLAIKNLMKFKAVKDFAKPYEKFLTKYYTPVHGKFLWHFTNKFLLRNSGSQKLAKNRVLNLYKTTSPENINLRTELMDKFKYYARKNEQAEVDALAKLCKDMEHNEEIRKFVQNTVERGLAVDSISELNSVIESTPLHKANYFFDNLRRIVALSEGQERQAALKNELDNPFFAPKDKRKTRVYQVRDNVKDLGALSKMQVYLINKLRVFIYNKFEAKSEVSKEIAKKSLSKLNIKNAAQERKIQLTKEVNDIIKTKLGKRTYNEQEDNFRLKATKIRLSLLPEIFESIKATRAQQRSMGIEPVVSNKNASRLYELINGSNRKIVTYMLKKCDINGNRIFDVKQIIEFIEKSNDKITTAKKQNPGYRAADARAYYENMYNDLTDKYGKLKRTAKAKA